MIRSASEDDRDAVIALWESAGLTRPWNDPIEDFNRAINGVTSEVFISEENYIAHGTVMCGYDGHRGWIYYLAVAESERGKGIGTSLLEKCEEWLASIGAPKILLMVRSSNVAVQEFYLKAGYKVEETSVMGKFLPK